jgi:hypothetical protein
MKKYSTYLTIMEMQIKAKSRFHGSLVSMAIIKIRNNKQMFARMSENKEPSYTVAGDIDSHYGKQCRGSSKNF